METSDLTQELQILPVNSDTDPVALAEQNAKTIHPVSIDLDETGWTIAQTKAFADAYRAALEDKTGTPGTNMLVFGTNLDPIDTEFLNFNVGVVFDRQHAHNPRKPGDYLSFLRDVLKDAGGSRADTKNHTARPDADPSPYYSEITGAPAVQKILDVLNTKTDTE